MLFSNSSQAFMCLSLSRGFHLAPAIKPRSAECCNDGCPSGSFSRLLSMAWRPALGRFFFHLRPRCSWEPSIFLFFLKPSPDLCLDTILSLSSAGSSFNLHGLVFALICIISCETLCRQVCAFPSHVQTI